MDIDSCVVVLTVSEDATGADAAAWLYDVAGRLGTVPGDVFVYQGRQFYWRDVVVERSDRAGLFAWRCPDAAGSDVWGASSPFAPNAFKSYAAGVDAGCEFAYLRR